MTEAVLRSSTAETPHATSAASDSLSMMLDVQLRARGVDDVALLDAFRTTPRDAFVSRSRRRDAYADRPVALDEGQSLPRPYDVARMILALDLAPNEAVFQVGVGSGFTAALLSAFAIQVHAVEWHETLAFAARRNLDSFGCDRVKIKVGDGHAGWPTADERKDYGGVLVTASAPSAPVALMRQLRPGTRLVIAIGPPAGPQTLMAFRRTGPESWNQTRLGMITLPPLIVG